MRKVSRPGAAARRLRSTGCWAVASWPSRSMYGSSSPRKRGSRSKAAASSPLRVAATAAVPPASRTKRDTSPLRRASAPTTVSARATTRSMVRVWRASIRSVWVVSRSPGCARRSAALRSSGRPASPAPSSPMMSRRRSAYGRRTMLFTRSSGIVELVWATGTRPPSGSRSRELPGWQSTKYSPMNDCGRMSQWASRRRSAKPGSRDLDLHDGERTRPTGRRPRDRSSCPARTPATLKSPPSTTPKALSNTIS